MKTVSIEGAIGRCRAEITSRLHGAFVPPPLVGAVLGSLDRLSAELVGRPASSEAGLWVFAAGRKVGNIHAAHADLVRAFGPPRQGDGVNVDVIWVVATASGGLATIYNWKNGAAYHGPDGLSVEAITEWEVSGTACAVLRDIEDAVRAGCEPG